MDQEAACAEDVRFIAKLKERALLTSWSTDGPGTSPEAGKGEDAFFGDFLLDYWTTSDQIRFMHEVGKGRLPRLFAKVSANELPRAERAMRAGMPFVTKVF